MTPAAMDRARKNVFIVHSRTKNDKNGEAWMRCVQCLRWAHELCAGIPDENDWKTFKCEICLKRKDSLKKKMLK